MCNENSTQKDTLYQFYLHTISGNDYHARQSIERYWQWQAELAEQEIHSRKARQQAQANARFDRVLTCG